MVLLGSQMQYTSCCSTHQQAPPLMSPKITLINLVAMQLFTRSSSGSAGLALMLFQRYTSTAARIWADEVS